MQYKLPKEVLLQTYGKNIELQYRSNSSCLISLSPELDDIYSIANKDVYPIRFKITGMSSGFPPRIKTSNLYIDVSALYSNTEEGSDVSEYSLGQSSAWMKASYIQNSTSDKETTAKIIIEPNEHTNGTSWNYNKDGISIRQYGYVSNSSFLSNGDDKSLELYQTYDVNGLTDYSNSNNIIESRYASLYIKTFGGSIASLNDDGYDITIEAGNVLTHRGLRAFNVFGDGASETEQQPIGTTYVKYETYIITGDFDDNTNGVLYSMNHKDAYRGTLSSLMNISYTFTYEHSQPTYKYTLGLVNNLTVNTNNLTVGLSRYIPCDVTLNGDLTVNGSLNASIHISSFSSPVTFDDTTTFNGVSTFNSGIDVSQILTSYTNNYYYPTSTRPTKEDFKGTLNFKKGSIFQLVIHFQSSNYSNVIQRVVFAGTTFTELKTIMSELENDEVNSYITQGSVYYGIALNTGRTVSASNSVPLFCILKGLNSGSSSTESTFLDDVNAILLDSFVIAQSTYSNSFDVYIRVPCMVTNDVSISLISPSAGSSSGNTPTAEIINGPHEY